jgi:7-keto-8-aminopelargonate synthetase-like enzyme
MAETPFDRRVADWLTDAERRDRARRPPLVTERRGAHYRLHGQPVLGLCSNDYLGFADHPRLRNPPREHVSAGASRLVCGDLEIHRHVEARLAALVDAPAALLFPSGAQLNLGVLASVLRPGDHAYSDALAHASLVDGLRLSRATRTILPHREAPPSPPSTSTSPTSASGSERANPAGTDASPDPAITWWISESIFSMDGDAFAAPDGRAFLDAGGALYLDEAHAIGLFAGGTAWSNAADLEPTLRVGTLGKAFATAGAFVAGSQAAIAWIAGHARSFVYTTGTSPLLAAQIDAAIDLVTGDEGDARREVLWRHVERVAQRWERPATSPIFPIVVGEDRIALDLARDLVERGVHVQPIRPPTVPEGTARLRVTVSAALTDDELGLALDILDAACRDHGIDPRAAVPRSRATPRTDAPSGET